MGKHGVKSSYEETNDTIVLSSDDDVEANEDLSLKIVEKSMQRKLRDDDFDGAAVENCFKVEFVDNIKESKDKKKEKKTKRKQRTESELDSVSIC